ncbi:MAG: FadR family transcriptional regulator [Actinobacteria bacterium]|nr:FadR family transcriptional regulator [Actinomycetota bacterium]
MSAATDAGVPGRSSARLSALVVDQFLTLVADGNLEPGQRLPPERALAERFEVGRNSVREALRVLELLGIVESRQGDGTYVREPTATALMAPFRLALGLSGADAALEEVLAFRRILEPGSAALAARNLDEEGRERLESSLRTFDRALAEDADAPPGLAADTDFHLAIAVASGNPLVIGVQRALLDVLTRFRAQLAPSSYDPAPQRITRGHHAVFGAIVARDPDAAHDAMARHLDDVAAALPASP